ncbi:MAG: hypothetical protein ABI746_07120 [Dermatophilaceae bacterium]
MQCGAVGEHLVELVRGRLQFGYEATNGQELIGWRLIGVRGIRP